MSFSCSLQPFQDRHQRSFSTELHHAACRLTFGKLLAMKRCKRRPTRPTTSVSTSALGLSCSSAQVPWLRPHCTWWLAPGRRCIYYSNVDLYSLKTNHQPHTLHYITSLSYCHYIWFSRVFETPVVWQYCEHISYLSWGEDAASHCEGCSSQPFPQDIQQVNGFAWHLALVQSNFNHTVQ